MLAFPGSVCTGGVATWLWEESLSQVEEFNASGSEGRAELEFGRWSSSVHQSVVVKRAECKSEAVD